MRHEPHAHPQDFSAQCKACVPDTDVLKEAVKTILISIEQAPGANTPSEIYKHLKLALEQSEKELKG